MISSLESQVLGNSVLDWIVALAILVGAGVVLRVALRVAAGRIRGYAERQRRESLAFFAGLVEATRAVTYVALGLGVALSFLVVPAATRSVIDAAVTVVVITQAASWVAALSAFGIRRWFAADGRLDPEELTIMGTLQFLASAVVWVVAALTLLDNLGVDVTTLVAGLGVGGVAIALAVQNVLGDLFASLSIVLDKPFVVGDFVVVGEQMGTVEHVGLKTTRLRSLGGEQLVIGNGDLLKSRIRNFKRMQERRVLFSFGILYETPRAKVGLVPELVREIVTSEAGTRFDRAHFAKFGASALDFEVVYFVLSADHNVFMDVQQRINLRIMERFEAEGIGFAYPTQTLHVVAQRPAHAELVDRALGS